MSRIVVLDDLATEGLEKLDAAPGIEYDIKIGLKGDELRDTLAQYDGAVCRSGVKITAESLEGNQSLKAIVRAGVGTDNIDKPAATRLGIVVREKSDRRFRACKRDVGIAKSSKAPRSSVRL